MIASKLGLAVALAVAFVMALATGPRAQAIQLASGALLVGEVQDATSDGLTFRRLDDGGVLELTWGDLSPVSADTVRRLEGLLVEDEVEPVVMADVFVYAIAGSVKQEIIGRIIAKDDKRFTVKRKDQTIEIPRDAIKDTGNREVPVFEVYTRDDYYQEQLAQHAPGEDADKHIGLAEALRRVGDYQNAEQHLLKAEQLGGGKQKSQLPVLLQNIRTLKGSAAERDALAKIRHARNRRDFAKAAELIAAFEQQFANSPLAGELDREKRRFETERKRAVTDRIVSMWEGAIHKVANDKCLDTKLSLSAARSYAESKMAGDIFAHIGATLELDPKEVEAVWGERPKARSAIFDYGVGSWVLGADAVIKDTKAAESLDDPAAAGQDDPELKRIIELIRSQRQRAAKRSGAQDAEETDETWWKDQKLAVRRQFLRVYFAEFGGQMEVTKAYATPCANCAGEGTVTELGSAGRPEKLKCTVCHGTRYMRLIRAR